MPAGCGGCTKLSVQVGNVIESRVRQNHGLCRDQAKGQTSAFFGTAPADSRVHSLKTHNYTPVAICVQGCQRIGDVGQHELQHTIVVAAHVHVSVSVCNNWPKSIVSLDCHRRSKHSNCTSQTVSPAFASSGLFSLHAP